MENENRISVSDNYVSVSSSTANLREIREIVFSILKKLKSLDKPKSVDIKTQLEAKNGKQENTI